MKKFSKSPLLVALISLSMIASTVGSSAAYGATKGPTAAEEQAAKDKAAAEARQKAAQDKATADAKTKAEQAAKDKVAQDKAAQDKAAQDKATADAKTKAEQAAKDKVAQDKVAQDKAAQDKATADAKTKAEQAAKDKVAKDKVAQDKAAQDKATADAKTKAEQAAKDKVAQDKVAQDKAAQDKATADAKTKAEQAAKDKVAKDKVAQDKAAQDKATADAKTKAEQAAKDKVAQDKVAQDKAAQDKATADAKTKAEQAAKDKVAKDKVAQDKAAQDKATADAKTKAEQAAKDKVTQDKLAQEIKAKADQAAKDKAARDAQEKANRKQPPQNPVGPPPVLKAKVEDKASVADKLRVAQSQTPVQAATARAEKDAAAQKIAHDAAVAAVDPKVKADQKAKEEAAQKAADEKAKQIANQKALERKAIQAQIPPVVKTEAQKAVQVQEKAKAKENISQPAKSIEVKKEKEVKAAQVEVVTIQKKSVVSEAKQKAVIAKQSVEIKQISQNPNQPISAAQAQKIAMNQKQIEMRMKQQENKPVVAAPTHVSGVVQMKVVGGQRLGLDPNRVQPVIVSTKIVIKPVVIVGGVRVPSHLAFPETQQNIRNANIRSENIHNTIINRTDITSIKITKNITNVTNVYVNNYQNVVIERSRVYNNYYYEPRHSYTNYYSSYYDHGFRGGYAYPVRVDIAIHEHFWNPVVLWMFDDSYNTEFYCQYYGHDYCYSYPITPFRYARVYYPTDTMRDLAIEVSGMSYYRHTYYRKALETMTDKLNQQISNYVDGRFYFGPNDIVINHYRNIGDGQIIVEGFVDRGSLHVAFKGRLDLENPYNSDVFVPTVSNFAQEPPLAIAVLNAIVAIEQAADAKNHIDTNVVYEEPAPAPLPIVNITCQTFSGELTGFGAAPDAGTASQAAIDQCSSKQGANATECSANYSCDDGVSYAPVVSCSTSSTNSNADPVYFPRKGRDADFASQMAQQLCIADDATADVDACSSIDNVTCVALDSSVLNPMVCNVSAPVVNSAADAAPTAFSFQSYDSDKARNRAISKCITADGTDVDDCNNVDNLICDYLNAPAAPVAPSPTCTATGPNGQSYSSGPRGDYRAAYNAAVKACTAANPLGFGVCESTAIANCPAAKN